MPVGIIRTFNRLSPINSPSVPLSAASPILFLLSWGFTYLSQLGIPLPTLSLCSTPSSSTFALFLLSPAPTMGRPSATSFGKLVSSLFASWAVASDVIGGLANVAALAPPSDALESLPPFFSQLRRCPAACSNCQSPEEWTVYSSFDRLKPCNETLLLDFSIHIPLDTPDIVVRACSTADNAPVNPAVAEIVTSQSSLDGEDEADSLPLLLLPLLSVSRQVIVTLSRRNWPGGPASTPASAVTAMMSSLLPKRYSTISRLLMDVMKPSFLASKLGPSYMYRLWQSRYFTNRETWPLAPMRWWSVSSQVPRLIRLVWYL